MPARQRSTAVGVVVLAIAALVVVGRLEHLGRSLPAPATAPPSPLSTFPPSITPTTLATGGQTLGLTFGQGAVWEMRPDGLAKLDPRNGRTVGFAPVPDLVFGTQGLAVGDGTVWVNDVPAGQMFRLDASTSRLVGALTGSRSLRLGASAFASGFGSLWLVCCGQGGTSNGIGTLTRVDERSGRVLAQIPLHGDPVGIALANGKVWVGDYLGESSSAVWRIDPVANKVTATVAMTGSPKFLVAGLGSVWAVVQGAGSALARCRAPSSASIPRAPE